LFSSLDTRGLEDLIASLDYYSFEQNEFIVKEGDVGSHIFISATGGLEVMLRGGSVAELPRGRTFGEQALLDKCPRSVSIVAGSPNVGVWGMNADAFREAAQKSMIARVKDHRAFLDTISLFEGLTVRQRDVVCDAATSRIVEANETLQLKDLDFKQFYLVKVGELRVLKVAPPQSSARMPNGRVNGGMDSVQLLRPGDVAGERTLLYGEPFCMEVSAVTRTELLVVDLQSLRQVIGDELQPIRLQRPSMFAALRHDKTLASITASQREVVVRNMEFVELTPDKEMPDAPPLFVVLDGSCQVVRAATVTNLSRGQCFGSLPFIATTHEDASQGGDASKAAAPSSIRPPSLAAGSSGCRLAALSRRGVSITLEELGLDPVSLGWDDKEHQLERMMVEISKVCVFRHLPRHRVDALARDIKRHMYSEGDVVWKQGDAGEVFCIVVSGEVVAKVDGWVVHQFGQGQYFGEREILLNEPRAATITVSSPKAEIWAIDKVTFNKVAKQNSHTMEQLQQRMWLQDYGIELRDLRPIDELGSGTSGVVQLVKHRSTGFNYALKRVPKGNGEAMALVKREIQVLSENDHPFIMHLVKTFETTKSFYMLTEYCAGGELHGAIRTIHHVLSRKMAMFYIGSLTLMLEVLHERHVVYRDLKPENIMLDSQGYLKLIDFGTAKKMDRNCLRTYTMVGTPHYMAPEVLRGKGYGTESDVWALGIILYELMIGYLPFATDIEDPAMGEEVINTVLKGDLQFPEGQDVDSKAKDLIEKLLVPNPACRLGCGHEGYRELKSHPFFGLDGLGIGDPGGESKGSNDHYFSLLLGRELQAPIAPTIKPIPEREDLPTTCEPYPPTPSSVKTAKDIWKNFDVEGLGTTAEGMHNSRDLVESPRPNYTVVSERATDLHLHLPESKCGKKRYEASSDKTVQPKSPKVPSQQNEPEAEDEPDNSLRS
jgi:cGMP-dependent protein kinase